MCTCKIAFSNLFGIVALFLRCLCIVAEYLAESILSTFIEKSFVPQLICVIQYIVLETESIGFNERGLSRMNHRLSQLVECALEERNTRILMTIIGHLNTESAVSR